MKSRIIAQIGALLFSGFASAGMATLAYADDSTCPLQSLCLWSGTGFTGTRQVIPAPPGTFLLCEQTTLPDGALSAQVTNGGGMNYVLASFESSCFGSDIAFMRSPPNLAFPISGYTNLPPARKFYSIYNFVESAAP